MIYKFKPSRERTEPFKDWYENTSATPRMAPDCAFYVTDLRTWFFRWVFK